jgi:hypothetical protein
VWALWGHPLCSHGPTRDAVVRRGCVRIMKRCQQPQSSPPILSKFPENISWPWRFKPNWRLKICDIFLKNHRKKVILNYFDKSLKNKISIF